MEKTIGIIGFGNMGSAIGGRLKSKYQIWAFDKVKNKTKDLLDIDITVTVTDLINRVDAVILAVKPQDFDKALMQIKKCIKDKLVISIAAGITTSYIEKNLGRVGVIRVMPNLPAKVGKGMICLCRGNFATSDDLSFAKILFSYMGTTIIIEEKMMNAATAVSGSGPGFFYDLIQAKPKENWEDYSQKEFIPALSLSAQKIGFTAEQADLLAKMTTEGSIALLEKTGLSPEALCTQVTSKGGTTAAGLAALKHNIGFLEEATKAALDRARELSRQ
jgi:pyrroline-5-carboxylate reductase